MGKIKNILQFDAMKLLYYSFFHSHLEFSSTFLFSTSKNNINKIEAMQKKAIRLLIGLPRISHTSEAFWALNILPFKVLCQYNVIKFLHHFKTGQLPSTFENDFFLSKHIKKINLRNKEDFYIPRAKSSKIGMLPPHNFPKIWQENKHIFPKQYTVDLLSNIRENLIDDYYKKNQCLNSKNCYVCKRIQDNKDEFVRIKLKRLKRVKEIIKHKGCQKTARINNMLGKTLFI